jgi:hypothetical protein
MNLNELRKKVIETIDSCYMLEDGKIYEFKIHVNLKGEKNVSAIYDEEPKSFTIGFEYPNHKKVWKPDYAKPFIDVMGIENNGKLILTDFNQGGWDVPNRWFTIHGDFFLAKENAESFKGC